MKAIILAAGEGRRLRPLTENIPKCMVELNGKPLLQYWLDNCQRSGINEVLINTHYLAEKITDFIDSVSHRYSMRIHCVHESELYGTGGTLKNNSDFIKGEEFFFFCHGDNFTNINIGKFIDFHTRKKSMLSVALFETNLPKQCGIAEEIGPDDRIVKFIEKPEKPTSNLASAAIFLMSPNLIKDFPDKKHIDFSKEILPAYQGRMYGYKFDGFNIDIGTLENYKTACTLATVS
ncbi:MAG: hypothetical protein A2020_07365 [Lentisphaerae bacterium GWF2_45_14]|nr:MAG: hypothetical protein A2020_07365 [Lentisphaerae bacterium GWF2_45_14]